MIPLLFIFDLCIMITVSGTCSTWEVIILDTQEDVTTVWDLRSNKGKYGDMEVHGFTDFGKKEIILYWGDLGNFSHEWKHAYCHEYYFYHLGINHQTMCEPFPHFKVQM